MPIASVLLAASLAACSEKAQAPSSVAPTHAPSLANTTGIPLYAGSRVVDTRDFTQVVNRTNAAAASNGDVLMTANGTYKGTELVAASGASFSELQGWVDQVGAKPPVGYTRVQSSDLQDASDNASRYGIAFTVLKKEENGKPTGIIVMVMDPTRVTRRLGPALSLISKYQSMPSALRSVIDEKVKQQTGFTVTEATQPDSPLGVALGALDEFSHSDQRAIVVVNARKE